MSSVAQQNFDKAPSLTTLRDLCEGHELSDPKYGFATQERDFAKFLLEKCDYMGAYNSATQFCEENDLLNNLPNGEEDVYGTGTYETTEEEAAKAGYLFIFDQSLNKFHVFSN